MQTAEAHISRVIQQHPIPSGMATSPFQPTISGPPPGTRLEQRTGTLAGGLLALRRVSGLATLALLTLSTGCATSVSLKVLEPAEIFVPPQLQTLAVIDRSQATTGGEKLLSIVEGALTGEQIGLDQEGRREAIAATVSDLSASPRFRVIQPVIDPRTAESDLLMSELSPAAAQRICARHQCDGIVALEMFDSDMTIVGKEVMTEYTDDQGKAHKKRQHEAHMDGQVVASWRLYDTRQGVILDQVTGQDREESWSFTSDTFEEAAAQLPDQGTWVNRSARELGSAYARRIAPTYVTVLRSYYGSCDARLKSARERVMINDWAGATAIWEGMASDPKNKLRGKALYNRAIAKEVEGDLNAALDLAKKACIEHSNGRCRDYVYTLEQRLRDQNKLKQQMAPPPVAPAAPPPPRAAPRKR